MTAFFSSAACSLFNTLKTRKPTGPSVCHGRLLKYLELQVTCTPKLHIAMFTIVDLLHNAKANYFWQALPLRLPAPNHLCVELYHIKRTQS